jgi:hypothetical protein
MATNTAVDPQTIVVKVVLPDKEALIVGARVPTDTKITRGTRATRLADLTVADSLGKLVQDTKIENKSLRFTSP